VRTFETDKELRAALERALGRKMDDALFAECKGDLHSDYSEADFEEILNTARNEIAELEEGDAEVRKPGDREIREVVRAIAEEVTLWQELRLHQIEPQLAEARTRLLGTNGVMDVERAQEFSRSFFSHEVLTIRPEYIALFLERHVLRRDYGELLETMQPNDEEYFLAVVALVMNRAYLSGTEAIGYILTGKRTVVPGLFNPTTILMTYRLALYLQPPGRPSRSLLVERELALLRLVGTASGHPKWPDLWVQWNHMYPDWYYVSWRDVAKAFYRAKKRLLNSYNMAFVYEHKETEDPEGFWRWLEETTARVSGQT